MKKSLLLSASAIMTSLSLSAADQFYVIMKDGSAESFPSEKVDSLSFDKPSGNITVKGFSDLEAKMMKMQQIIDSLSGIVAGMNNGAASPSNGSYAGVYKLSTNNVDELIQIGSDGKIEYLKNNGYFYNDTLYGYKLHIDSKAKLNCGFSGATLTYTDASNQNKSLKLQSFGDGNLTINDKQYAPAMTEAEYESFKDSLFKRNLDINSYIGVYKKQGDCYVIIRSNGKLEYYTKDYVYKTYDSESQTWIAPSNIHTEIADVSSFELSKYGAIAIVPDYDGGMVKISMLPDHTNLYKSEEFTEAYFDSLKASIKECPVKKPSVGVKKGSYYYVDLGLPSGTKWATSNVGAKSPEEKGDYFFNGETAPEFTSDNYWDKEISDIADSVGVDKYGSTQWELKPEYDAATVNMGKEWRTPNDKELEELRAN